MKKALFVRNFYVEKRFLEKREATSGAFVSIHKRYARRRDILFSACTWGADDTKSWIRETGANMWRSTGDIYDTWKSVENLANEQESILPYGGVGCFNDMDMLVVGMYGKGNVGLTGLTDAQYKAHFTLWSLFASPLMIGCDIRNMNKETLEILSNKELIKINQDADCRQVMKLNLLHLEANLKCYARNLENGDIAVGIFNFDEKDATAKLNLDELGLPESTGMTLEMTELWTNETVKVKNGTLVRSLKPFECLAYRCKVVNI